VAAVAMAMNRRRVNDEPHFMDEGPSIYDQEVYAC